MLKLRKILGIFFASRIPYYFLLLIGVILLLPSPAEASVVTDTLGLIVGIIASLFISLLGTLFTWLVTILVSVAQFNHFIDLEMVQIGWSLARDVANMFFIVVLLIIAFSTILKIQSYHYQRTLVKLIIMAVLINFSKLIAGFLIDFFQVIMLTFVNGFKDIAAGNFADAFQIYKMLSLSQDSGGIIDGQAEAAVAAVLGVIMLIIADMVLLIMIAVLLYRIAMLWVLVILSPLAYLAYAISPKYWSMWWQMFFQHLTSGPVIAFFLWLALLTSQKGELEDKMAVTFKSITGEDKEVDDTYLGVNINSTALLNYMTIIALLLGGLAIAQKMAQQSGSVVGSFAQKVQKYGTRAAMIGTGAVPLAWLGKKAVSYADERTGGWLNPRNYIEAFKERRAHRKAIRTMQAKGTLRDLFDYGAMRAARDLVALRGVRFRGKYDKIAETQKKIEEIRKQLEYPHGLGEKRREELKKKKKELEGNLKVFESNEREEKINFDDKIEKARRRGDMKTVKHLENQKKERMEFYQTEKSKVQSELGKINSELEKTDPELEEIEKKRLTEEISNAANELQVIKMGLMPLSEASAAKVQAEQKVQQILKVDQLESTRKHLLSMTKWNEKEGRLEAIEGKEEQVEKIKKFVQDELGVDIDRYERMRRETVERVAEFDKSRKVWIKKDGVDQDDFNTEMMNYITYLGLEEDSSLDDNEKQLLFQEKDKTTQYDSYIKKVKKGERLKESDLQDISAIGEKVNIKTSLSNIELDKLAEDLEERLEGLKVEASIKPLTQAEVDELTKQLDQLIAEQEELRREAIKIRPGMSDFYRRQAIKTLEQEEYKKFNDIDDASELWDYYLEAQKKKDVAMQSAILKKMAADGNDNEFLNYAGYSSDSHGFRQFVEEQLINKGGFKHDTAMALASEISYINEKVGHWETARLIKKEAGEYKWMSEKEHVMSSLAEIMKRNPRDIARKLNRLAYGGERPNVMGGRDFELGKLGMAILKMVGPYMASQLEKETNPNIIMNLYNANKNTGILDRMLEEGELNIDFYKRLMKVVRQIERTPTLDAVINRIFSLR